ncbi:MAG: hypothetical protein HRT47_02620 [Candidatus Caenarcaniphilales bacterium]|nr:hypothetical protein [Candidatus Caenarcaniphilales bacterium]
MSKKTETNNKQVIFKTAESYSIKVNREIEHGEITINSPKGETIASISNVNREDSDSHFDYQCSLMLDDGTEIYFQKLETENSKLTNGVYIISDDILFYSDLNSEFKELKLASIEFDLLHSETNEDKSIQTYHYSDNKWILIQGNDSIENIAYESFGSFQKNEEKLEKPENNQDKEESKTEDSKNLDDTSLEDKIEALDEETLEIYHELNIANASRAQKETFFNYYFEQGVEEIVLKIFTKMILNKESEEKFLKLDNYVREIHGLDDNLTAIQEEKQIISYLSE